MSKVDPELEPIVADAIELLRMFSRYCNPGSYMHEHDARGAIKKEVDGVLARLFAFQGKWYSDPRIRTFEEKARDKKSTDHPVHPDGASD